MAKITVQGTEVSITKLNGEDYICLTDMMKAKDGEFFVTDWLRNRNTMEFLGVWEKVYNPNFNYGEFAIIRNQAGLNSFKIRRNHKDRLAGSSICSYKQLNQVACPCGSVSLWFFRPCPLASPHRPRFASI